MQLRKYVPTVLVAVTAAALTSAAPAVSHGVQHALFAHKAHKVDGKHAVGAGATRKKAAGKLVATRAKGKNKGTLPPKFIPGLGRTKSIHHGGLLGTGTVLSAYGPLVSIEAPTRGFVVVTGGLSFRDLNCTTVDGCWAISDVQHLQSGTHSGDMRGGGSTSVDTEFFSIPVSTVFAVEAGTNSFQIRAARDGGNGTISVLGSNLAATFVPFGPEGKPQ